MSVTLPLALPDGVVVQGSPKGPHPNGIDEPDVILYHLADNPNVVFVLPQRSKRLVDIGSRALNDESAVLPKNDSQVNRRPKPGLSCTMSQLIVQ